MSPEPTPLPDDVERAIPRGSRVPWERRLLRLVEPADPAAPVASPEPEPVEPPESAPLADRLAYWQERATWATTSAEHEAAVSALARLRSGHHKAVEPAPAPPAATPPMRTVMIKEVLERDSAGLISKIKEYQITEPLPPADAPTAERLEPPAS